MGGEGVSLTNLSLRSAVRYSNCGVVDSRPLSEVVGAVRWLRGLLDFFAFGSCCHFRYLADLSSFGEILTYHTSEDCQLCFWKRAKQPFPGSAINKEEICSLLSFVFAGSVLNRDGTTPGPKKKNTAHCPILDFRTYCSTLSWLRCAFFRLRLNFAFEPFTWRTFSLAVAYSCWVQLARQQILHKLPVQGFCSLPCWVSACATH